MSKDNTHYITIPNIWDCSTSTFWGKSSYSDLHNESTVLRGEMFFDSELVKNEKIEKHYREGLLVGKVDFYLSDAEDIEDCHSWIAICESHVGYENFIQEVELVIGCTKEVFEELKRSSNNGKEVRVRFDTIEWEKEDSSYSEYSSKCKVIEIEVTSIRKNVNWFEKCRVRHIENFLLTNLCGGWTEGQIPTICKEFANAFADKSLFDNHKEILIEVLALIRSIKWDLEIKKSKLREEIEENDDLEFSKLFNLSGKEFYLQFDKVAEKDKGRILAEYNTFWRRFNAEEMFKESYAWDSHESFLSLAEEYLKIQSLNSPTLNKILIDGLLKREIASTVFNLQSLSKQISFQALLLIPIGVYEKTKIKSKDFNFKETLLIGATKSIFWWIGLGLRGLFVWWITSLIASNSEVGHYVLFGTIFAADMIVTTLNFKTAELSEESNEYDREEYCFYILRDMCALNKQSEYMDTKLLRHLLYKIEERGVQMNNYIYEILNRT